MLVLSRRTGEEIFINGNIKVTVVSVKGDRVRIGITAPDDVSVDRAEVHQRRMQFVDVPVAVCCHDDESIPLGSIIHKSADDTMPH